MRILRWLGPAALAALVAAPCEASDGYKALARQFSRAARKAGVARVAVLPFAPAALGSASDGWNIAERLITQLVRAGGVKTVERGLLRRVLEEHSLARTGVIDQTSLKRLGKILAVDAILTGTFQPEGRRLAVSARLIDIETGVIVAAGEETVAKRWAESDGVPSPSVSGAAFWSLAEAEGAASAPVLEGNEVRGRDAGEKIDCARAAERVDDLERSILDFKARYWALQLRKGFSWANLQQIPGAMISEEDLRWRFYDLINRYYTGGEIPPLSEADSRLFMSVDERAYRLHHDCSLYASL